MAFSIKKMKLKRILFILGAIVAVVFIAVIASFYYVVYAPNVKLDGKESTIVFIPTGSHYEDVLEILTEEGIVSNIRTFSWLAEQKNYPARVMPGRYRIYSGTGNNSLINLLRSGEQEAVRLTFTNIRTKEQLSGILAAQLETDSMSILQMLREPDRFTTMGLDTLTGILLFIPDTYEVYWTIGVDGLLARMHREYEAFWNDARRARAVQIGLSPVEVGILASIVQSETSKREENARIAGVYMNRLQRNIPLQADPTVIFATGDFNIRRVLNRHLAIDSPFNTYMYSGLPPGPITLPEPHVLDAVLHYENHNYLYFSAKPDFSGYHVFARTYQEHLANARRYRQALNELNVFR
ncbi:MAG: endolytic transglycosylase MltG [Bacteroidia bacterium]|nr:MAG: endolytic transglycosylase MltG [Bacteroidia bacterium]